MNNKMELKKFEDGFSTTSAAKSFAAAIEARVMGAREAGISASTKLSVHAPQHMHGVAA